MLEMAKHRMFLNPRVYTLSSSNRDNCFMLQPGAIRLSELIRLEQREVQMTELGVTQEGRLSSPETGGKFHSLGRRELRKG